MQRLLISAMVVLVMTSSALAQSQVGTFSNQYGWSPGDESNGQLTFFNIIKVSLEVKNSTLDGKAYYVATFYNSSDEDVAIGARVTNNEPSDTHFMLHIPAGEERTWGEHLPNGLTRLYVLVSQPRSEKQ